jgi:hypothetical protein
MYRKQNLWDELDMNKSGKDGEEIYASPKVVEVSELMNTYIEELGYKPIKYIYDINKIAKPGIYTKTSDCKAETAETLRDMVAGVVEVIPCRKLLEPSCRTRMR